MKDELMCPDCGEIMVLKDGPYGKFYGCVSYPACSATHGVHSVTGKPLGIPANMETRKMRINAHMAFDKLWRNANRMHSFSRRGWAYFWLQTQMGLTSAECHIGRFDIEQCKQVIELCNKSR